MKYNKLLNKFYEKKIKKKFYYYFFCIKTFLKISSSNLISCWKMINLSRLTISNDR